jgi:hypothetical protein
MKINIFYLGCLLATMALFSCHKEEALTPSEEEQGYVVPQGNHDYDATIVNFYNKYGTYLLYEFTGKDTYWTPNSWKGTVESTTGNGFWSPGYEVVKANPLYVKNQLELLDSTWFRFYSEKFLHAFLPVKIMLCANIDSIYSKVITFNPVTYEKVAVPVTAWYNYDNICVGNGMASIESMTATDKKKYMAKINLIFAQSIIGRRLVSATAAFAGIANYTTTINTTALRYAQGIINHSSPSPDNDWGAYILAMVSMSETNLNKSTAATDATFLGILNATKDVNGKIRSRYNIVRNYFITNYNVDLQVIGNLAN